MSVIDTAIGTQAFELIRDRLGELLADELAQQFTLVNNTIFQSRIFMERFIPFNESEIYQGAINITVARQMLNNQSLLQSDGINTFFIDVYQCAKNTTEDGNAIDGASLATKKMHRLCGVIRAIIEDARYKTLGFAPPFIANRHVVEIKFNNPKVEEKVGLSTGRVIVQVRASELNGRSTPTVLADLKTTVKIGESDAGYTYIGEAIPPPQEGFDYVLNYILP
jgi:hypothetical protein